MSPSWPALDGPHAPDAVTLDVFDTAVTRRWAAPRHVFLASGEAMRAAGLVSVDDHAWMELRLDGEQRARARCGGDRTRLIDIYDELARRLGWSAHHCRRAMELELAAERASLRPVPAFLELWHALGALGRRRRFLSDMYLDEAQLTDLLEGAGYAVQGGEVWTSSTRGASKREGGLYGLALRAWSDLRPDQVLHLGDHPISDVEQARRAGLRATVVRAAHLPRTAQRVLSLPAVPLRLRSLVAGAVRLAGLQSPSEAEEGSRAQALRRLGAAYAGPLLTLYVWWLLEHARAQGLRRLYFLARDGQVLLQIARLLQASGCAPGVELRYLHASRQAWFAPSIVRWDAASLEAALDEPTGYADPAKLARRLGFDDEEQLFAHWPALRPELSNVRSVEQIAGLIVRHVSAVDGLSHTAALRRTVLGYLRQEGLMDGMPWAIVDLGWRGRLQNALSRMLQSTGQSDAVRGYYVKLLSRPTDQAVAGRVHSWCEAGALPGPAHLLELLCEADHGSTRGYRSDGTGMVRPLFDERPAPEVLAWGLADYRRGVAAFATELAAALPLLGQTVPTREALHAMAVAIGRELFGRPAVDVARVLASIPCTHSVDHDGHVALSAPLAGPDAWLRAVSLGRLRLTPRACAWLPGSLALAADGRPYQVYAALHRGADAVRERWTGRPG